MDIQVVHHQMDGLGFRILNGHLEGYLRELKRRTVRCGECEMAADFGFYGTEDISRAAALVFVISSRFPPLAPVGASRLPRPPVARSTGHGLRAGRCRPWQ